MVLGCYVVSTCLPFLYLAPPVHATDYSKRLKGVFGLGPQLWTQSTQTSNGET